MYLGGINKRKIIDFRKFLNNNIKIRCRSSETSNLKERFSETKLQKSTNFRLSVSQKERAFVKIGVILFTEKKHVISKSKRLSQR